MRTYGESFIIADQSPMIMDRAVIRNTNTKVIFKLPDEDDRRIVGKAVGLTELQINEISRLETGVSVIYQGNWLSPVLCKVSYYDELKYQPYIYNRPFIKIEE